MNIYQAEVEDFSRCIVSGAAPAGVGARTAIHIHHVMAAAVQSSRDGAEVVIPRAAAAKGEAQPC